MKPNRNPNDKHGKNLILLAWNSFFTDVSSEMIVPLFPIFLKSLGANNTFLGFVEGIAEFFAKALPLIIGYAIEKTKKVKIFAVVGYIISNIAKPFLAFVYCPFYAALIRWIDRIGKGIRGTPRDLLISLDVKDEKKGKYFTFQRQFDKAGAILGALISLVLLNLLHVNIRVIFLISLIPALFSIYLLLFKIYEPKDVKFENPKFDFNLIFQYKRVYLSISLIGFLLISYGLFFSKFLSYNYALFAYLLLNFSGFLTFHFLKHFSDKVSKKKQVKWFFAFFALFYFGFSFVRTRSMALIFIFLYGALLNYSQVLLVARAAEVKEHTAIAIGLTYLTLGISSIIGNSFFGYLMDIIGFSKSSLIFAMISFVVLFLF